MKNIFFYGLYMDPGFRGGGAAGPGRIVRLDGFTCVLGTRSTLKPAPGQSVYGTLAALSDEEVERLYPAATHADYLEQEVIVRDTDEKLIPASVFVCPPNRVGSHDALYAGKLIDLCKRLDLPCPYVAKLVALTERRSSGAIE